MTGTPNFLVIGAMKCATSSLHEQLALQPGIFMTDLKEPNFFSDDGQYEKGGNWYMSLFNPEETDCLYGESSTHYTKLPTYPETIDRMRAHIDAVDDLKFIYVIRHPIDRLVSQYIHEWSQRIISSKTDINEAIYSFPELVDYSRYSMQLQPYFQNFGKENVLPVFFERLTRNPQPELERICSFLGYANKPVWHHDLNAQNVSSERMRQSEWREFLVDAPVLSHIRKTLIPKSFRTRVRRLWTLSERPQLSAENLEYLEKIFDQDLEILKSWLDCETLTCKNFKQIATQQNS
ncbi:MAG: sulfotransferase [Leptolyngbya sp. SIO3F4]|nr:sulfotransferase [Leptolyngbya sp. SIO3F4]